MTVPPKPRPSAPAPVEQSFSRRHAKVINALFVALCLYVALIWLVALDQKFHWGLFSREPAAVP